ncbi:hypothetical protein [Okeania sp.]|uniref:hypothetical protein n=1 Tax=Okeania sp. TaxID=3100323 RepID=UPI002B4ADF6A|nr:hypothetical protein [Okeania sp.]MEB3341960.1 hypothetical protein [Okeania sp.]
MRDTTNPTGEVTPPFTIDLTKLEGLSQDILSKLGNLSVIVQEIDSAQGIDTEGIKQKLTDIKTSVDLAQSQFSGEISVGFGTINAAANAINAAVAALDSNTSRLLQDLKTIGIDSVYRLDDVVNFSEMNLSEMMKANAELAGVKTGVLALKAEHDESQAKQDLQRQVSEETNRLLAPKNLLHKSVIVDFSSLQTITITGGTGNFFSSTYSNTITNY